MFVGPPLFPRIPSIGSRFWPATPTWLLLEPFTICAALVRPMKLPEPVVNVFITDRSKPSPLEFCAMMLLASPRLVLELLE